jgi:putative DNA primase/helicase
MRPAEKVLEVVRGRPPYEERFNLTDLGNAERFVALHGEDVRYCYPWRKWLVWSGARWEPDDSGTVHRLAKVTVRSIYQEAAEAESESRRKELGKHATGSEAEARIRAMLELAKSEVPVSPHELDRDPWVLNCRNGTVDLVGSGELTAHRREDLITKIAPLEHHPDADAPTWRATLERVLPNAEIRAFFKRLCGYALTGSTAEHVLPILYGTGANGKSTVLNALLDTLGDYATQAAPDLLIAKRNSHPTELADLFGMRLVAAIEVEDGRRLAESLVKQLTGGDRVKARKMRQDFWEFEPTHKVFMAVNHKPTVRGTDTAIWRRIRLIPFTEYIPPEEQDKRLPEKLRKERAGILAWAVEGCLEWQREGLQAPDEVRKATGEYRIEMDVLGAFLRECCATASDYKVSAKDLYDCYKLWCGETGERHETQRKFVSQLNERGRFERKRSGASGTYEWHGLQLLNHWKAAICRKTEVTEPKLDINSSKNTPREENGTLGSVGSVGSVTDRYNQLVEERMSGLETCIHGVVGGCHLCSADRDGPA